MLEILKPVEVLNDIHPQNSELLMICGVNGSGKTTTIGKLANYYKKKDNKLLLAAGDTFRAAAIEQLQHWGQVNDVPVVAQQMGSDSAAVIFDALQSGKANKKDLIIADTAGRLHNKDQLMKEIAKVLKVVKKQSETAPEHVWLVIDGSMGQNTLVQARVFHEHLNLTGLVITKLDGAAKGGIVFSIAKELNLPIYFVGLGEGVEDLQRFNAQLFVDALLYE